MSVVCHPSKDEDGEGPVETAEAPFVRQGPSCLTDLPAELRLYIYQFLLPQNIFISFEPIKPDSPRAQFCEEPRDEVKAKCARVPEWRVVITPKHERYDIQTQLFLVSKAVLQEARAILYGSNTFKFTIDSGGYVPNSLQSPHIFGPSGDAWTHSVLRELRSIYLDFPLTDGTHWGEKRQRARLECFVSVLKEHSNDENKKSLLQKLTVKMSRNPRALATKRYGPAPQKRHRTNKECYMFGLESLTELRGIEHVEILGVPEWYKECLELCMRGKGREIGTTEWPLVQVRKKNSRKQEGKGKPTWVTSRKWYQPKLKWKDFAKRNRVAVPEDMDKYWMDKM